MTPSGQREEKGKDRMTRWKTHWFRNEERNSNKGGNAKVCRSLDEWIIESTTETPHRSLTHVAIARTDDIEHNRRLFPVSSCSPFIGMQASLLKVIRRAGFGKSCTASCATINFWCPLSPASLLLNKPNFRSGMLMTGSTRKDDISSTCHEKTRMARRWSIKTIPPFVRRDFSLARVPT